MVILRIKLFRIILFLRSILLIFVLLRSLKDEIKHGDSTKVNDLVREQYEKLPYPGVSQKYISEEEEYYKNNGETVKHMSPTDTLENFNHYLHRGNENFR